MPFLSILNGGVLKRLNIEDINYYYDNMDSQIELLKGFLEKYTQYQESIASQIKKIGGEGTIYGAIIDIDYYNHICVNPFDGTVSAYHADDTIDKFVFENIPSLLKEKCPQLYQNYEKILLKEKSNALIVKGQSADIIKEPTYCPGTEIYKYSSKIKKMQKLYNGILTVWYDDNGKLLNDNNSLIVYK